MLAYGMRRNPNLIDWFQVGTFVSHVSLHTIYSMIVDMMLDDT